MTPNVPTIEVRLTRALNDAAASLDVEIPEPVRAPSGTVGARRPRRGVTTAAVGIAAVLVVVAAALVWQQVSEAGPDHTVGPAAQSGRPIEEAPERLRVGRSDVDVHLVVNATDDQIANVRSTIEASTRVKRFAYVDHQAAYETFRQIFRDDPDLVQNVDPTDLPRSFRIVSRSCRSREALADRLESLAGVDEVALSPGYSREDAELVGTRYEAYLRGRGRCPDPR